VPQAVSALPVMQTPLTQHPSGHEAPLHAQAPSTHAVPLGQAAPVPHRHSPAVEHVSVVTSSHAMHAAPPLPQVAWPRARQKPPAQHPSGQLPALQVPAPSD
jgi:hypothetical protein